MRCRARGVNRSLLLPSLLKSAKQEEDLKTKGLKISHLFQVTSTDIEMQWKITELGRLAWKIPKFITQKGERHASENFHENSILRLVTVGGQSVGLVFEQKILT